MKTMLSSVRDTSKCFQKKYLLIILVYNKFYKLTFFSQNYSSNFLFFLYQVNIFYLFFYLMFSFSMKIILNFFLLLYEARPGHKFSLQQIDAPKDLTDLLPDKATCQ